MIKEHLAYELLPGSSETRPYMPGALVKYRVIDGDELGLVIAKRGEQITVLWTGPQREKLSSHQTPGIFIQEYACTPWTPERAQKAYEAQEIQGYDLHLRSNGKIEVEVQEFPKKEYYDQLDREMSFDGRRRFKW